MKRQIALACFAALLAASSARGAITVQNYYRMGENDPSPSPGGVPSTTKDSVGTKDLQLPGGPIYNTGVAAEAAARVGSSYALNFFTATVYGTYASVISTATDNFGLEAWVYPTSTSGSHVVFYNGNPGSSGFGVRVFNGTWEILYGGVIFTGGGTVANNTWSHVALVRAGGVSTLYVNGAPTVTTALPPNPAVGSFAIAAPPSPTGDYWLGLLDEIRFFTFTAGQFSTNDLLRRAPDIGVAQPAGSNINDGGSKSFGSVNVGANTSLAFTITNTGVSVLTNLSLTIDGTAAAQFSVTASPGAMVAPNGSTTFTIQFAPSSIGNKTAALHLTSNDPEETPYDITLTGLGSGPEIGVFTGVGTAAGTERTDNVGTHNFGNVVVTSGSAAQTFTITNTGNANLTGLALTKIGGTSGDFSVSALGATTLAPGAATTFTVTFSPTATGVRAAEIDIASNDSNENPFEIYLIGTGVVPEIAVFTGAGTGGAERTDNSGTHNFADTVVGGSSAAQTFTITNKGDGNLSGLALSKSGSNPGDFTLSGLGATTLAPNAATTFTVTFSPTVVGVRNAVVSIASNDGDENPFEINVSGAGVSSEISVEQPAGTPLFTGQAKGWGWNLIGQTTIPPLGQFGIRAIASRESTTLALRNDGTVIGWGYGVTNGGPYPVPAGLTGAKAVAVGSSHYLVLKNDGTLVAWGNDIQGTSLGSVPTGIVAIAAGSGFNAVLKNDGTVVAWGNNGSGRTNVPPGLTGVMAIAVGNSHTLALKSNGTVVAWGDNGVGQTNVPAGLTNVIAIGAGGSHSLAAKSDGTVVGWGLNGDGQATAPASASNVVAVTGGANHSLALRSDGKVIAWGLNSIGETTVPASVTGAKAIAAGSYFSVAAYDSAIDFGNQSVGSASSAKTFTVKNTGPAPLNITNVSVTGLNASDFTVNTAGMLASVPATSGQTTFAVTFNPGALGLRAARLRVLNSDSDENPYEVFLTGTGLSAPEIGIFTGAGTTPADERTDNVGTNVFSPVIVGSNSVSQTFTITNTGSANLTGLAVTKSGAHSGDFTLSALGATTLAPNVSTTFTVTFVPTAGGTRNAVVSIASNDGDENPFEINVSGVGLAAEITVEQPAGTSVTDGGNRNFGFVNVGSSNTLTFTVRNDGNADLSLTGNPRVAVSGANAGDFTVNVQPASVLLGNSQTNMGFEAPAIGSGFSYGNTQAGWNFGATAGLAGNGSPWFVNPAPEGVQAAFIQENGGGETAATMSRAIFFPSAGKHLIRFALVRRGSGYEGNDVDVRMDGVTLATISNTVQTDDEWRTFTVEYDCPSAGSHTLSFVGTRTGGDVASVIDDVRVTGQTIFQVTFTPSVTGLRTATLSIANNDSDENPFEINVSGTGVLPEIAVEQPSGSVIADGGSKDFGSVDVGANTALTFNLRNLGGAELILSGTPKVAVSGTHAADFTVTAQPVSPVVGGGDAFTFANGSFEAPQLAPGGFQYAPEGEGWIFGTAAGLARIGSPWFVNDAPDGDQAAFLQLGSSDAIVSRAINFPTTGNYVIRFSLVRRGSGYQGNDVDVRMDGITLGTVMNTSQPDDVWRTFNVPYICTVAGDHTLAFAGTRGGADNASCVDDVQILGGTTFAVQFAPSAGGVRTATLSIANNDSDENPYDITLTGTGTGLFFPEIGVFTGTNTAPANARTSNVGTHSFANTVIGTNSAAQVFTITNTGNGDLTNLTLTKTGAHTNDFTLGALGTNTLAPNASTTFTVTFAPVSGGTRSAVVSILSNDGDENPFGINVSGSGQGPEIAVYTGFYSSTTERTNNIGTNVFAATSLVSTSAPQPFVIRNAGTANLSNIVVSLTGAHPGDFLLGAPGTNTLAPSASTTFTVTFAPTAFGQRSAEAAIASNDGDENPFVINLRGPGGGPEIAVFTGASTNAVDERVDNVGTNVFATRGVGSNSVQVFTIKNIGETNLTGLSVSRGGANFGDFIVSSSLGTNNLAPNASTTFTVTFAPTVAGDRNAYLVIFSNDGNESAFEIYVRGTGLAPEISIEQPANQPLVATSGRIVAWGNNTYGQIVVPGGLTNVQAIALGNSHSVALRSNGTVVAWGLNSSGQTNVPGGLTNVQAISAGLDFNMALRSNGTVVAWGYSGYGLTAVPAGLTNVQAVAAGTYQATALRMDGTVVTWGAPTYLATNVSAGLTGLVAIAAGSEFNLGLRNNGTVVAWGYNGFGQTNVPASVTNVQAIAAGLYHAVALRSNGTVVVWGNSGYGLTTTSIGMSNVQAIAAGGDHVVVLRSNGAVVAWGRNDFGQTNVPVGLTNVTAIRAGVSHTAVLSDFRLAVGTQAVATASAARTFTIKNTGSLPLNITNVTVTGGNASDFTVNTNGMLTSLPATNGQTTFSVVFTPGAAGERTATLRVLNNDRDENPFDIVLTGTGGVAPEIDVKGNGVDIADDDSTPSTADHTDFGIVNLSGDTIVRTFTITNSGSADVILGSVTISGTNAADFVVNVQPAASLVAGESTTFQITFTPGAAGLRSAALSFTNNDVDENPYNFTLAGTGEEAAPLPPTINTPSLTVLGNGAFQLNFANTNSATFSVLAATNISLPASNWTVLGTATNLGGGLYQFIDPDATNYPSRYYKLRFP